MADSYFASVDTAIACSRHGLYFTGLVKNSSKFFPKKWCQTVGMTERGETKTAVAVKNGVQMVAHTWNDPGKPGKPRKALISTMGSTVEVDPAQRPRKRKSEAMGVWETVYRLVKRTKLVKHYFTYAGLIDRHNRKRMDGLRLELTHEFKIWWKRVFTSFLGVIIVDALAAFILEQGDIDQLQFYEELAAELIWNSWEGAPPRDAPRASGRGVSRQQWLGGAGGGRRGPVPEHARIAESFLSAVDPERCHHEIQALKKLEQYSEVKDARLNCRVCKKQRATLYCVTCGRNAHNQILALCSPFVSSSCLSLHCQTPV